MAAIRYAAVLAASLQLLACQPDTRTQDAPTDAPSVAMNAAPADAPTDAPAAEPAAPHDRAASLDYLITSAGNDFKWNSTDSLTARLQRAVE
jgi:hypothetical protein